MAVYRAVTLSSRVLLLNELEREASLPWADGAARFIQRGIECVSKAFVPEASSLSNSTGHGISRHRPCIVRKGHPKHWCDPSVVNRRQLDCFGNLPFDAKLPIVDVVFRGVALELLTALVVLPFDERKHDPPAATIDLYVA